MSERIFVVEDDPGIRELTRCMLQSSGFLPFCFEAGEEMLSAIGDTPPDLFILDIMLPGMDGIEILQKLRRDALTKDIPVIMLTAKSTEIDKVTGLDTGANDYIVKPFGVLEFMARVRAVLRGAASKKASRLSAGGISMDTDSHIVTLDGAKIELTLKEFELLRLLLRNTGRVVHRSDILSEVWGTDFAGETRTLDMHVGSLRHKLHDDADKPRYIETVRGVGYRLRSSMD